MFVTSRVLSSQMKRFLFWTHRRPNEQGPWQDGFEKYAHLSHQQAVQGVVNKQIERVGRLESKESSPGIALTEKKDVTLKKD